MREEGRTEPPRQKAHWTIGRKLAVIVAVCIGVGYIVLIFTQVYSLSKQSYSLALNKNIHLTKLLAAEVSGGVHWKRPESIERAYGALTSDRESSLASIIVLDVSGKPLTRYQASDDRTIDLIREIGNSRSGQESGEIYVAEADDHVAIVVPVVSGPQRARVGTLAVGWSLTSHHARVFDELVRQTLLGVAMIAGLITIIVVLIQKFVSKPLIAVIKTTLSLADGDTNVPVPFTGRRDEIGELARSLRVFERNLVTIDNLNAEQREHNEQLQAALEKEREFNAMQREFVAMASHEFRTPLTIIDSGAQRIERRLDRMEPEQIKSKTQQIRQAVRRMTTLIESVLGSASFDAGSFKIDVGQCNLRTIVADVCQRQQEVSKSHDIRVNLADLPEEIVGDARLLEQVFTNLLSNAVKYAPDSPRIEVTGLLEKNEAVVSVHDMGVGIPKAEQVRIYDRYFRASTATGIAGTGIGLNLALQTIELHGGRIDLESDEGKGTTFSVRLPVRNLAKSQRAADGSDEGASGAPENFSQTQQRAV